MARIMTLTDCAPDDTGWKGAISWRIIQALAESHHEVLVLTTLDLERIQLTHPRLTVTRPIQTWRVDQLPKLTKILLTYKPQIIHTFALTPSRLWPALTIWPYFNSICALIPGLKRVATLFDAQDASASDPAYKWLEGSKPITVFSEEHRAALSRQLDRSIEVVPLDLESDTGDTKSVVNARILIPAAVSEWQDPHQGLRHLVEYLLRRPETSAQIVGGWGDLPHSERKVGWQILEGVAARVMMLEHLSLKRFLPELEASDELWLEPLRRDSWKFLLCMRLAQQMHKRLFVSSPITLALPSGSTANSLSRLYRN
jgi:hypothetical protein